MIWIVAPFAVTFVFAAGCYCRDGWQDDTFEAIFASGLTSISTSFVLWMMH